MPEENPFIALRFPNRPPPENPNLPLTPPVDETLPAAVAAEETEVQVAVGNDPNTGAPITEESSLLEDIVDVGVTGPVRGIYQGLDAASDLLQSGVDALGIPSHLIRNRDDGSIELLTSEEVEDRGGDPQNTLLQRAVDANVPQTIGWQPHSRTGPSGHQPARWGQHHWSPTCSRGGLRCYPRCPHSRHGHPLGPHRVPRG